MRVNVYAEEMTDRVEIIGKEINGHTFTGLRFYLELPCTVPNGGGIGYKEHRGPFLHGAADHHTSSPLPATVDDDSAAVTFWGKQDLRVVLRKALAMLDEHYEKKGK